MLHREEADGLVVITQPAHAWISGQLARAWGNDRFGVVTPAEEVCLGAEQHDIGWKGWEGAPTLNPATGRPHSFMELPLASLLAIWSGASAAAIIQGRYPALLVSLHGTHLYAGRDPARDTPEEARAIQAFLTRERAVQERLLVGLRAEPRYVAAVSPTAVARNQRLVAVWDWLSLRICMGLHTERRIEAVPSAGEPVTLTLRPGDGDPTHISVAPWPFSAATVTLVGEGRRLPGRFADEAALRAALADAAWVTLVTTLVPA